MISVLAFDVVVLFAYGVAHTGKSASNDLIVLAITVVPTYLVAGSIWFLSRFMEKRLRNNGAWQVVAADIDNLANKKCLILVTMIKFSERIADLVDNLFPIKDRNEVGTY